MLGQLVSFFSIKDFQGKMSCGATDLRLGSMPDAMHPLYHLLPRPIVRHEWDQTIQALLSYCTDEELMPIIQDFADKLYAPYSKYPAATSVLEEIIAAIESVYGIKVSASGYDPSKHYHINFLRTESVGDVLNVLELMTGGHYSSTNASI